MKLQIKFFFKYCKLILILLLFLQKNILAEVFSSPSISRPTSPGKFGARSLDWSASDKGEISYTIPIQTPGLRQLNIDLSIKYSPSEAYGEVGPFWGFNLPKLTLDIKRGATKYISSTNCLTSKAENLYINGNRFIPLSNGGSWVSNLNSGRDILRCNQNGFIYYKSNGEIYHFGSSSEAQVANENGNAIEWYLSKKSTFQGLQEISFKYLRPNISSSHYKYAGNRNFNLISRPLLESIYADDVTIKVNYEENSFKNPHFQGGFGQIIFGRVSEIKVLKNEKDIRSYQFKYENNNKTSFPRLVSFQEFGSDKETAMPNTFFSYRGENSSLSESFDSIYESYDYSLVTLKRGITKFADILGTGKTQAIQQAGQNSLWLHSYDPRKIFQENGKGGLKNTNTYEIKFKGKTNSWASSKLSNISFLDFSGTGVMDFFSATGSNDRNPVIVFNDRKISENNELVLERFATFRTRDINFMRTCDPDPRNWKAIDFAGNGKSDFVCFGGGYIYALLNKNIYEVDKKDKRYEVEFEQLQITMESYLNRAKNEDIAVVDWNADGLPDLLTFLGNKVTIYLNNGLLVKGERKGDFFEKFDLGFYPNLNYKKASQVLIGDFTGTGLPSISYEQKRYLINNGLGKQLTEVFIKNATHFMPNHASVVQLTGTGKQQIIAATLAANGNTIFELSGRAFPNLLHSVVTGDGRFLSFNYSSSALENNEAVNTDNDAEIQKIEKNLPLMPVVVPLLKQIGISDGLNPTRMTRYAYRIPNYDRALKKFLGFSLVRKQTVGDKTQAGELTEQRFLSGYRLSEAELASEHYQDIRLESEKNIFSQGEGSFCIEKVETIFNTNWCTEIAGYNYSNIKGAASNELSFATGKINSTENYLKNLNYISLRFFHDENLSTTNTQYDKTKIFAQILIDSSIAEKTGEIFYKHNKTIQKVTNFYDEYGRLISKILNNSPHLNGDDHISTFSYFCPLSHQENPKVFCDSIEVNRTYSTQGTVKAITKKVVYDTITGKPVEEWSTNQNGELVLQTIAQYDDYSRITSIQKQTGEKSLFEWDSSNANLKSVSDQDDVTIHANYNDLGLITKIENSKGSVSEFEYDPLGRLLSTSKNLGGKSPLITNNESKSNWEIIISWLKSIFGMINITSFSTDSAFNTSESNSVILYEKYEYAFPKIAINYSSMEELLLSWNQFDKQLPIIPTAENYNVNTLGYFQNTEIIPGHVTIYRRNHENEKLSLISKIWLSGADEVLYSASRLNEDKFSLTNKSSINTIGKVYKEYLSTEITLQEVLENKLPKPENFQVKSIYSFYANGEIATEEFDSGAILRMINGVDFTENISPEGRRSKIVYNQLGQIITKYIGLDSNGNASEKTLTTLMSYDALGRIIELKNNDGLIAWQTFGANNLVEAQSNNTLGVSKYFYDNFGRNTESLLCPIGINIDNCSVTHSSILYKINNFNLNGKLEKSEHIKFNRENGTNAKEIISYVYGSKEKGNRSEDFGLPVIVSVKSLSELGVSESVRNYSYNKEGAIVTEELELFLTVLKRNSNFELFEKKSIGVYQLEKIIDLAGNLTHLRSRGGFARENLTELRDNDFTGYAAYYEAGTNLIKTIRFLQNGKEQSVPLQNVNYDAQGFANRINLENNLQLQACWHKRKEVPLAFWAGNKNSSPSDLCDETSVPRESLFHTAWNYDNDLFPTEVKDLSGKKVTDANNSGNSAFTYDLQGRLTSVSGFGEESLNWGKIEYDYSVGGKINKVVRQGNFIKNRIAANANLLIDNYYYSTEGQIGVLKSVTSTDGFETANLEFENNNIGFRKFGAVPSLAVFSPERKLSSQNNQSSNKSTENSSNNKETDSWNNPKEIPMQKYVWNGRGQLAGVFSVSEKRNETNELLNFRMSDENGNQLAEFDGVTFEEMAHSQISEKKSFVKINKLPRNVAFSQGINFERDEIHFNIDLGIFATLRLITRFPGLNAADPTLLNSAFMQSRQELVLKDHVGSVSQVIDISVHKIVERNISEPFGLIKGLPLMTNSKINKFKIEGLRQDISLYTNQKSNMRQAWERKSFEVLGTTNRDELTGMRGSEAFAKGKFSAVSGLHSMGVRAYDPARGVWLSPDLFMGRNFEAIVSSPIEANLFQYAGNNPVSKNDPTGKSYGLGINENQKSIKQDFSLGIDDSFENNFEKTNNKESSFDTKDQSIQTLNTHSKSVYSEDYWKDGVLFNSKGIPLGEKSLGNEKIELLTSTATQVMAFFTGKKLLGAVIELAKSTFGTSRSNSQEQNTQLCFVAGTLVVTEAGAKEIQDIRTGDKVAAKNPETGEIEFKTVVQTFAHEEEFLITVDVGYANITSTAEHPFYVIGEGYTPAYLLSPGKQLLTTSGTTHYVIGTKFKRQKQMVYNFEVAEYHNYFVSNDGYLVHNACENPNPLENTTYEPKVIKQMQPNVKTGKPDYHGFPDIVDNYAGNGTQKTIVGGDGLVRTKIELEGSYGGKPGKFEWIIESNNKINHRLFVPYK